MKIGCICHDAFPIAQPYQGGLEMITSLLVTELVNRGHQVVSLCVKGSELPGDMVYYDELSNSECSAKDELTNLTNVSRSLNRFFQMQFDILQNHSLHYQSMILGNLSNKPFVTTFHTPIFPYLNVGIEAISSKIHQTFTGVSKSLCTLYQNHLPRVLPIYNGIDLSQWEVEYDTVSNYYSWSGRICKEKGVAEVIQLCIANNVSLKIAGPISDPEYFEDHVKPFLNYDIISYVGHLTQSKLNEHIKHSRGFIFSSVWEEPYGLVIAEALACGVPVLANAVGAAPEIINNTCGCLFSLAHPTTFVSGLNTLKTLDRRACRARAEDFCDHYKMVDSYEKLYESLYAASLKEVYV